MEKIKKATSLLLAAVMLAAVTGCSKETKKATNSTAESQSPVTISVLFLGDNTPPATNSVLKEIAKKTNITMNAIYVTNADYATKLNTLTASNSLPDLFKITNVSDAANYKKNGALADLTKILPKYGTHIYPAIKSDITKNSLNSSGKIYAMFPTAVTYQANMNIRTDWLKNVGLSMPTDLDSLYNVFDAFTNKDPDKNGKKDTFGLVASMTTGWINYSTIFGAYGIPTGTLQVSKPVQLANGTVTTFMKHPNYLAAIKYFNKLYQNGLMDVDFATVPTMTSFGKLWSGKGGAIDFQCVGPTNNWMPSRYTEAVTPTFDFATIKGPNGKYGYATQYPDYTVSVVVSAKCEHPEAAVRLADYLFSDEGDQLAKLGIEGVHFNWVDKTAGTYSVIKPYDVSATSRNDGVFVYWNFLTPKINTEVRTFNKQTQDGVALTMKNSVITWPFITTAFAADKTYGSSLQNIERQAFCSLVTSKGDLAKEYAAFVKQWEAEGGTQWEKDATAAYKAQK
jgi:putative aldouronate transport system substrate-binding protein